MEEKVWDALREVNDPEVGLNIVDLGLVYGVEIWPQGDIQIQMTMTTPACPLGAHIKQAAQASVRAALPEVKSVVVDVVWDPPWSPMMITEAGRKELETRGV